MEEVMPDITFTKDAILAINKAFDIAESTNNNIELFVSKDLSTGATLYTLADMEEEPTKDHRKLNKIEGANFDVYIKKGHIKNFDGVEIDYALVYSELDNKEGEIFIFHKGKQDVAK